MKRLLSIFFLGVSLLSATGQTILIKETVPYNFSDEDGNFGPNRGFFEYPYMSFGFNSDLFSYTNDEILKIKPFSSPALNFGSKYVFKLNNLSAIVWDLNVGFNQYKLKGVQASIPYDTTAKYKSAKFQTYSLGTNLSLRINLKPKRGNVLGKYIDLGGYIDWLWGRQFKIKYEGQQADYYITEKKLKLLQNYQYGFSVQYGGGIFGVFARYRINNLYKTNTPIAFPRTTIGISIFMSEI